MTKNFGKDVMNTIVVTVRDHSREFNVDVLAQDLVHSWKNKREEWAPNGIYLVKERFFTSRIPFPAGGGEEIAGQPEIALFPRENIFALRYLNASQNPTLKGWWFLVEFGGAQYLKKPSLGVDINIEGEISVLFGDHLVKFSRDDVVWPWPAIFPDRFKTFSRLKEIIVPGKCNPLTGLLAAPHAPTKTLASQIRHELEQLEKMWGKEIILEILSITVFV